MQMRTLNPLVEGSIPSRPTNSMLARTTAATKHYIALLGLRRSYASPLSSPLSDRQGLAVVDAFRDHGGRFRSRLCAESNLRGMHVRFREIQCSVAGRARDFGMARLFCRKCVRGANHLYLQRASVRHFGRHAVY